MSAVTVPAARGEFLARVYGPAVKRLFVFLLDLTVAGAAMDAAGGGIGFLLIQWIRLLDFRAAGIAVWFIAITVAILDYISAEIRNRFV